MEGIQKQPVLARPYQLDMLERARESNIIVYLGTGTGKTFIAVSLIKELQSAILSNGKSFEDRKWTVFLANTVPLVTQQADYLKKNLHVKVSDYYGELNVDLWSKEKWMSEFEANEVLVMSPDIFLNIIEHDLMRLNQFNLLILDEVHRAVSNHSYRRVMKSYSELYQASNMDKSKCPRILGLTGAVINKKVSLPKIEESIKNLEMTLFSKVVTPPNLKECQEFMTKPSEYLIEYHNVEPPDILLDVDELAKTLLTKSKKIPRPCKENMAVAVKPLNIIKSYMNQISYCVANLGLRATYLCLEEAISELTECTKNIIIPDEALQDFCGIAVAELEKLKGMLSKCLDVEKTRHSTKVVRLFELIRHVYENMEEPKVLVFVERRVVASVLCRMLQEELTASNNFHKPILADYVVGTSGEYGVYNKVSSTGVKFNFRTVAKLLDQFRSGALNLLVCTNVLEEGLDVTSCNVVIRIDPIPDFRSYIQSRGRARKIPSWYFVLASSMDFNKSEDTLVSYHDTEKILELVCQSRALPSDVDSVQHLQDDILEPFRLNECLLSAKITMHSCMGLLAWYVNTLPSDKFTSLVPVWKTEASDDAKAPYVCSVKLPVKSQIKGWVKGDPQVTVAVAKRSAALRVCRRLYDCGALNEQLFPQLNKKLNILDRTCTKKRNAANVYNIKVPLALQKPIVSGSKCYLYPLEMTVLRGRDDIRINSKNCNNSIYRLGIVSRHGNLMMPPVRLYSRMGIVEINIGTRIQFDEEIINHFPLLKTFHEFVFRNVLRIDNSFLKRNFFAGCNVVVVPLLKETNKLEFNLLERVRSATGTDLFRVPTDEQRKAMTFNEDDYKDTIVNAWHDGKNLRFYVYNVLHGVNPLSKSSKKVSFVEYFKTIHNLEIFHTDWPMIEVGYTTHKLNLLSPNTNDTVRAVKSSLTFPPELVNIHPIPASLWEQLMCIPCYFHRMEHLLKVYEFWNLVYQEVGIGKPITIKETIALPVDLLDLDLSYNKNKGPSVWQLLSCFTTMKAADSMSLERNEFLGDSFLKFSVSHFVYSKESNKDEGIMSELKRKLISNDFLLQLGRSKNLPSFIIARHFDPVRNWVPPGFVFDVSDNIRSGLQESGVPDDFWSLTDFPNYATSSKEDISKFIKRRFDERNQTNNKGTSSLKATYLCDMNFVSDKTVADNIEALIGCYLQYCGIQGAILFMKWIGIDILEEKNDCVRICDKYEPRLEFPQTAVIGVVNPKYYDLLKSISGVEDIINYSFKDKSFLLQALTHSSYSDNETTSCLETLEFLGDAVLDYVITVEIFNRDPDLTPGQLTDVRSALVNNTLFGCLCVKLGLQKFLVSLSPALLSAINGFVETQQECVSVDNYGVYLYTLIEESETEQTELISLPKTIADLFESIAGAVYLDSKSLKTVWRVYKPFFEEFLDKYIKNPPINPKRYLQELLGPDVKKIIFDMKEDANKVTATLNLWGRTFIGTGASSKNAKCAAAKGAVRYYQTKKKKEI